MNTFLPYPAFAKSAACLDRQRLGKQRVEVLQIYNALTQVNYGWQNHPAVKMWKGQEISLLTYGIVVCGEWQRRGYQDSFRFRFLDLREVEALSVGCTFCPTEKYFGASFHASHRSNLLRKFPEWYSQFGWTEPNNLPYVWPV